MAQDYSDIPGKIIVFHKLANMYGWNWMEFCETPYFVIKDLLKLIDRYGERSRSIFERQ